MRRRTLLLPYDGTAWADDLLRLACQLALGSEKHMAVLVLSVTRIPPSLPLAPLPASVDCRGHAMLDHAEEVANSQGYAVETCLARAYHVADAIVAAAADLQADAILLALSPGRWPWTRWAYARTVRAVRHHAPCPMLTGSPAATDDLDALAAIAAAQRLVSPPQPATGAVRRAAYLPVDRAARSDEPAR